MLHRLTKEEQDELLKMYEESSGLSEAVLSYLKYSATQDQKDGYAPHIEKYRQFLKDVIQEKNLPLPEVKKEKIEVTEEKKIEVYKSRNIKL